MFGSRDDAFVFVFSFFGLYCFSASPDSGHRIRDAPKVLGHKYLARRECIMYQRTTENYTKSLASCRAQDNNI